MADREIEGISSQLDTLTRMAALLLVQNRQRLADQIDVLHRAGLQPKLIADLLETTPNTVSVQISRKRALARTARPSQRGVTSEPPS
jgi:hypothetical protein